MTDEQSKPTICKECGHSIPDESWLDWRCSANPRPNFVTRIDRMLSYCSTKNDKGECAEYLCAVCGLSPCACGTGHMGEVE